jgi:hypothetical protein
MCCADRELARFGQRSLAFLGGVASYACHLAVRYHRFSAFGPWQHVIRLPRVLWQSERSRVIFKDRPELLLTVHNIVSVRG